MLKFMELDKKKRFTTYNLINKTNRVNGVKKDNMNQLKVNQKRVLIL